MATTKQCLRAVRLTARQKEILTILGGLIGGSGGWGEVWSQYGFDETSRASPLAMRNFDRVVEALQRAGLIVTTDNVTEITELGRAALLDSSLAKVSP